jgi:hypothetical protein
MAGLSQEGALTFACLRRDDAMAVAGEPAPGWSRDFIL